MPTVINNNDFRTRIAGADLTTAQYKFVTLEADGTVILADATTDKIYGVLQNSPNTGQSALVKVTGQSKITASEVLANEAFVSTTNAGLAVTSTSAQYARGVIVSPAGAPNDLAVIELFYDASNTGTGVQGITGLQGITGIQGITGLVGETGIQGITGIVGETGIQGQTGIAVDAQASLLLTAGAAVSTQTLLFGDTVTEGLAFQVIDEVVTTTNAVEDNLTETIPDGAVILSVQVNLDTTIAGDASGDDGLTKIGVGTTADPDKYCLTADLIQNTKFDVIPDFAVVSGPEQICVKAADNAGAAVTEKFVAGGEVRVRIVYLVTNSLDDA